MTSDKMLEFHNHAFNMYTTTTIQCIWHCYFLSIQYAYGKYPN